MDFQGLRVLVVLPMYGGSLPVGRGCVKGLAKLGVLAETFEAPAFYSAYTALSELRVARERLAYLEQVYLQVVSQAVLAKVESFAPDLVLAMAQAPLTRQALKRLRKDGVPTAMWFVEDHRLFPYWEAFAPLYDIFAVIQREPFIAKLQQIGVERVLYLPLCADPDIHKPLELNNLERRRFGSMLSFMGAGYPNRRLLFRRLMHHDFKIWGNDWDGEETLARLLQDPEHRVTAEEAAMIFNASAINLNLHSSLETDNLVAPGDFVNPRTFELAMCGAFQLVDRRELLGELFAADEMATFASVEEFEAKIAHFLLREDERQAFASRARARALKDHTYESRMRELCEFAAASLPDWPKAKERTETTALLPEAMRSEVEELLDGMGLTGEAAFEDVIAGLRAKQGKLSAVETALLFLDEWRAQYARPA